MSGVWWGSLQAKEQMFLRILAAGLGDLPWQRSSSGPIHSAARDCVDQKESNLEINNYSMFMFSVQVNVQSLGTCIKVWR